MLASIVRSPLISVARLELSTAEAAAFISRPRLAILREVYLVAKEEEKKRKEGGESHPHVLVFKSDELTDLSSDLTVHLPNLPVSPSALSPDGGSEKRSHSEFQASATMIDNKENMPTSLPGSFGEHQQKRMKQAQPPPRLTPLVTTQTNTQPTYFEQPFTYAPSATWQRDPSTSQHTAVPPYLSPYPSEFAHGSEYGRSPNPDMGGVDRTTYPAHPGHLAPLLNHTHSHSPIDSPIFPTSATLAPPPSAAAASAFYTRTTPASYMQQQQMDYLQTHSQGYDFGSPYLADNAWDGTFAQAV